MKNHKIKLGKSSELTFAIEVLKLGYSVSMPLDEDNSYDAIVDNGKTLLKVQVRSVRTLKKKRYSHHNYQVYHINVPKNKKVDIVACYLEPENQWLLIPRKELKCTSFSLNPKEAIRGSKYTKYKDNWKILKGE